MRQLLLQRGAERVLLEIRPGALRDAGCAVLVVSEELDELLALSDRLMVMARGRLSPALPVAEATVERIGLWMSGLWDGRESDGAVASGIGRTEEGSMA